MVNNISFLKKIKQLQKISFTKVIYIVLQFCLYTCAIFFSIISVLDLSGYSYKFKATYEFTNVNGKEYVVLFQGNNTIFVADYHTEKISSHKNIENLIIYTKTYSLSNALEREYTNKTFYNIDINKYDSPPLNSEK